MATEVKIDPADLRKLLDNIAKKKTAAKNATEIGLTKCGLIVARDYIANVNRAGLIDTGRWIGSITFNEVNYGTDSPYVEIGSTTTEPPYPGYHEFGTSWLPATPTLTPAYENNKERMKKIIGDTFKGEVLK